MLKNKTFLYYICLFENPHSSGKSLPGFDLFFVEGVWTVLFGKQFLPKKNGEHNHQNQIKYCKQPCSACQQVLRCCITNIKNAARHMYKQYCAQAGVIKTMKFYKKHYQMKHDLEYAPEQDGCHSQPYSIW